MSKTLPDKLRESANPWAGNMFGCTHIRAAIVGDANCYGRLCSECVHEMLNSLADQIEAEEAKVAAQVSQFGLLPGSVAWPRFEDGELVKLGDEYVDCDGDIVPVDNIRFSLDGAWVNGYDLIKPGRRILRTVPEPDTFESVAAEMLAEIESNDNGPEIDGYLARFRKLLGGE